MIDVYIGIRIESAENLSEITSILNIEPTMQHENGDLIGYDVKSKCNSWTLKRQLVKNGTTIMTVKNFFEQYSSILENKDKLIKNGSMCTRLRYLRIPMLLPKCTWRQLPMTRTNGFIKWESNKFFRDVVKNGILFTCFFICRIPD